MKLSDLVNDWPKAIALTILTVFLFWAHACQPAVKSLIAPGQKVTRPELQIELDTIIATAEFRMADLDQQEAFRDIIFKNALLMVEGGSLNPLGILTLLAGLYGVGRGTGDLVKKVKEKKNANA